jgi:hypothetical protein
MNPDPMNPDPIDPDDLQTLRDSGIPTDRAGNVLEDDQVNPEDALPAGSDFNLNDLAQNADKPGN